MDQRDKEHRGQPLGRLKGLFPLGNIDLQARSVFVASVNLLPMFAVSFGKLHLKLLLLISDGIIVVEPGGLCFSAGTSP